MDGVEHMSGHEKDDRYRQMGGRVCISRRNAEGDGDEDRSLLLLILLSILPSSIVLTSIVRLHCHTSNRRQRRHKAPINMIYIVYDDARPLG